MSSKSFMLISVKTTVASMQIKYSLCILGVPHNQITLNAGVFYVEGQNPMYFCTFPPCRSHDPPAIWAHLYPIMDMVKVQFPDLKNLHFFSDSPAIQYRQRGKFYLISTEPSLSGFKNATWSFFEVSLGKGAPDGVGGSLKSMVICLSARVRTYQMQKPSVSK